MEFPQLFIRMAFEFTARLTTPSLVVCVLE